MSIDVDVLVLGAGISGLATAFWLKERGATVEMLEAAPRAGGVIGTRHRNGALVEHGPNSALDTSPLINELLDRIGIRGERLDANAVAATPLHRARRQARRPALVPRRVARDEGVLARRQAALCCASRSLRAAPADAEESIAGFVRRRLGAEFLDYAVDPFVSGVYAGDPERISVSAAFPRLHALEQKYGSLLKGQILGARERKRSGERAKNTAASFSFRGGMQSLTDALANAVGRIETGVTVRRIEPGADGIWTVAGARGGEPVLRRAKRGRARHARARSREADARALASGDPGPRRHRIRRQSRASRPRTVAPTSSIRSPASAFSCRRRNPAGSSARCSRAACSRVARRTNIVLLTTFVGGMRNPELPARSDGHARHAGARGADGARRRDESADLGSTSRTGRARFRSTTSAMPGGCVRSRMPSARGRGFSSAAATAAAYRSATASNRRTPPPMPRRASSLACGCRSSALESTRPAALAFAPAAPQNR